MFEVYVHDAEYIFFSVNYRYPRFLSKWSEAKLRNKINDNERSDM